jgi:hypothetical protein
MDVLPRKYPKLIKEIELKPLEIDMEARIHGAQKVLVIHGQCSSSLLYFPISSSPRSSPLFLSSYSGMPRWDMLLV